jgi:hypothetical protein
MADKQNGAHGAGQATASATAAATAEKPKKLPKAEAVRRAITALGEEATRADLQGYILQTFGFKMSLNHISKCKAKLAMRAAKATPPAGSQAAATKSAAASAASRKPAAPRSLPAQSAPAWHIRTAGGNGLSAGSISLEDVLTAKILIDRVGAGPLKTLIDGLAK